MVIGSAGALLQASPGSLVSFTEKSSPSKAMSSAVSNTPWLSLVPRKVVRLHLLTCPGRTTTKEVMVTVVPVLEQSAFLRRRRDQD